MIFKDDIDVVNKIQKIREQLNQSVYNIKFKPNYSLKNILENIDDFKSNKNKIKAVGRVFAKRNDNMFFEIDDSTSRVQCVCHDKNQRQFIDLGDYLGIEGFASETKTDKSVIEVEKIYYVSKSCTGLPKEYFGINEENTHRVLQTIADKEAFNTIKIRNYVNFFARKFFNERDYIEVETPYLHPIAGGAEADVFETFHNATKKNLFLRIAPELYLKSMMISGFNKVFEIGKSFRNEGISVKHNPEFTMLECYTSFEDLDFVIDLFKSFFEYILSSVANLNLSPSVLDFSDKTWEVFTFQEAVFNVIGECDINSLFSVRKAAEGKICFDEDQSSYDICDEIVDKFVESKPLCIIKDHPLEISPLAKATSENSSFAARFEAFINGIEVANGYEELTNPFKQYEIFKKKHEENNKKDIDIRYINDMRCGPQNMSGLGIGLDRICMLILGKRMRNVMLFKQT